MTRLLSKILPLAGVLLALGVTAASAAPGIVLSPTALRTGPGTGFARVTTLMPGIRVEVISCSKSWCLVHRIGPDGYVARSQLKNPYYSTLKNYYQFPPKLLHQPGRTPLVGR